MQIITKGQLQQPGLKQSHLPRDARLSVGEGGIVGAERRESERERAQERERRERQDNWSEA